MAVAPPLHAKASATPAYHRRVATEIPLPDYLDLVRADRRRLQISMPEELVAIKGASRPAKRRYRIAQDALQEEVARYLTDRSRSLYRGRVAVSLALLGRAAAVRERATKGILDALKGCLYADDAQISLLEVTALKPAHDEPARAYIKASSESEYRRRFDAVRRALVDRDFDSWGADDAGDLPNPWAWPEDTDDAWDRLDDARDHLNWSRSTDLFDEPDRERHVQSSKVFYEHLLRKRLLEAPFGWDDRPGPIAQGDGFDRVIIKGQPLERLQPGAFWLEPPVRGEEGSFSLRVQNAVEDARRRTPAINVLRGHPLVLDIALDGRAGSEFDLDNLASKVVRGFRAGLEWDARDPCAYRIYRREMDEAGLLARIRSFDSFTSLETAVGGHLLGLDFVPDRRD